MGLFDLFVNKGAKLEDFMERNAVIIDVRTPQEYSGGHVAGSMNIPLDRVSNEMEKIRKMEKPVITCCASGMRSASAANQMMRYGIEAINGGPWTKVNSKMSK